MKKRLIQLLADNRGVPGAGLRVQTQDDEATLYLYDTIVGSKAEAEWFGGVDPLTFALELEKIRASTIHLRIDSPGGDVFGARAIEQALREHPADIVVHVDGYAASAASIVMLAGDDIVIAEGGMIMIHRAWSLAWGNADDMMAMAELLEKVDGTIAESYARRTGRDKAYFEQAMAAETWYTAQEALDAGLVDRIYEVPARDAQNLIPWNLRALGRGAPKRPQPAARSDAPCRASFERRYVHLEKIAA
jgi:ATP-dependent Clp protease protease subunit